MWEKSLSRLRHCEKSHPEDLGHEHTDLLIGLGHHYQKLSSCSYRQHMPRRASSHRAKTEALLKPTFVARRARLLPFPIGRLQSWLGTLQLAVPPLLPLSIHSVYTRPCEQVILQTRRLCWVKGKASSSQLCRFPRQPLGQPSFTEVGAAPGALLYQSVLGFARQPCQNCSSATAHPTSFLSHSPANQALSQV